MRTILLERILTPYNRHRKFFDQEKIAQLALSIRDKGLLHAPVLRKVGETYELVAGERRLRAMSELHERQLPFAYDGVQVPSNETPYNLIEDLPYIKVREAELEENVIRADLTWQERDKALADLDALRKEQNPKATRRM